MSTGTTGKLSGSAQTWTEDLAELEARRERALEMGGPDRVKGEHERGRLTARERIDLLLDKGSFQEVGKLATMTVRGPDGKVQKTLPASQICGFGTVNRRRVAVVAEDYSVARGPQTIYLEKDKGVFGTPGYIEQLAYTWEIPLVAFLQSTGGDVSIQESLDYQYMPNGMNVSPLVELLDRVPMVTAVMGPVAGSSAGRAVCSHFSLFSRPNGALFAGGPPLVERSLGQKLDKFELGGYKIHTQAMGSIDNGCDTEEEVVAQIKTFLSYLPDNVHQLPPRLAPEDPPDRSCDELLDIVPNHPRRVFDVRAMLECVFDRGSFFEIGPEWGRALITGFARLGGVTIGVLASDARHSGGAMTVTAADKQTRFADLCDLFHVPMVYFSDNPGLMLGADAERGGVLRKGLRAAQALHGATVPVITIQVRRVFGVGGWMTGSPTQLSVKLCWPSAILGDMPVEGGVAASFGKEIAAAPDPKAKQREIEERMLAKTSVWQTAEHFGLEDVIDPRETRRALHRWLEGALYTLRAGPKVGPKYRP